MLRLLLRQNELCEVFDDEIEDNDSGPGFALVSFGRLSSVIVALPGYLLYYFTKHCKIY